MIMIFLKHWFQANICCTVLQETTRSSDGTLKSEHSNQSDVLSPEPSQSQTTSPQTNQSAASPPVMNNSGLTRTPSHNSGNRQEIQRLANFFSPSQLHGATGGMASSTPYDLTAKGQHDGKQQLFRQDIDQYICLKKRPMYWLYWSLQDRLVSTIKSDYGKQFQATVKFRKWSNIIRTRCSDHASENVIRERQDGSLHDLCGALSLDVSGFIRLYKSHFIGNSAC